MPIPHFLPGIRDSDWKIVAKMVQIRFHVAKSEITRSDPLVDDTRNGVEPIGMPTFHSCIEATENEEVAMDQFVQKDGENEATIIIRVVQDRI
jgi:hypothetical protein